MVVSLAAGVGTDLALRVTVTDNGIGVAFSNSAALPVDRLS